jgi:hypothetical protein
MDRPLKLANQPIHRMTAPRLQLAIRTALEGAVIGDLGRSAFLSHDSS